ncbi:nitrogen fixation protein NifU [Methylocystis sp. H62]|uniref:nitrogen fixation protein NifU n=1 Tax=Methylocystis sp. H62 TaxID=2785789 RepID=UPI0018C22DFF|nr:nitrogen fixation protein NifU [Methylocystis sp. H62]MBG0795185.1 nitrogen fixation protein NifU [Methylocystis sp. H62]
MSGEARETETLEQSLARLEKLMATLESIADATGREAARELLALVLDLHARSLARVTTIIAASDDGAAMLEKIVEDRDLRAILLLHGLHPHSVERRLQDVIARMQPQWRARGLHVSLMSASEAFAMVQLQRNGVAEPTDQLRLEIENALTDAAPDLDDILIEMDMTALYAETAA